MKYNNILFKLEEELEKTKKHKLSLKRTTREEYNVFTMLVKYYEEQIKKYSKNHQVIR